MDDDYQRDKTPRALGYSTAVVKEIDKKGKAKTGI